MVSKIKEIVEKWPEDSARPSLLVAELRGSGLRDHQILEVIHVLESICIHCFDAPAGCHCWNDE